MSFIYNKYMEFGKILKELRKENNMTQVQLALKLHVTDTAVRCWENKGNEPPYKTLCEIAKIFEVTIGQLLGVEEY